jgi:hypothetical protein
MSSYRPPHRRDARKVEDEQKLNTANFPSLTSARPTTAKSGNQYAKLAERWAVDEEVDRRMAEYKRLQEEADKRDMERIAARHAQRTRYARHDEEYDQEELAPAAVAAGGGMSLGDDDGWSEVKRKTRKPKRELTVEEMDERDRQREQAEKNSGEDFNGHLFDSNRHDHDKV